MVVFYPVTSSTSMADQVIDFFKTLSNSGDEEVTYEDLHETSTVLANVEINPVTGPGEYKDLKFSKRGYFNFSPFRCRL